MIDCTGPDFKQIINQLIVNIKKDNYKGYDPYDSLNSPYFKKINNRWIKILCTQTLVYSPINLREFLKINKSINPKAMGLILSSLSKLKKNNFTFETYKQEKESEYLYKWLIKHANKKYTGICWGYQFPWQDLHKYIPKHEPSIVCTSFVGHALLDYYDVIKNKKILDVIDSICKFIIHDLNVYKDTDGICFSYSPFDKNVVHNANLLGASFLARSGMIQNKKQYIDQAIKSYNFSIKKQNPDGSWYYSINPETHKPRKQFDFHQGYIIDSLLDYVKYIKKDDKVIEKIMLGADFYIKQFSEDGKSYWRYPKKWPTDIHNQAQGIITFSKLSKVFYKEKFLDFSKKILTWTITNMQDNSGCFYYQKWPMSTNKIIYLRWSQAWMIKALSDYLCRLSLESVSDDR